MLEGRKGTITILNLFSGLAVENPDEIEQIVEKAR